MERLSNRELTTDKSGFVHIILPNAETESGFTSFQIAVSTLLAGLEYLINKNNPNGYAGLDANGKIPNTLINDSLLGAVNYKGTWNANTNTPTLPSPVGVKGDYYVVNTAGTYNAINFGVKDWVISNGTEWQQVVNTDTISSVFSRVGNILASNGDYNADQITETDRLFFSLLERQKLASLSEETKASILAKLEITTLSGSNTGDQDLSAINAAIAALPTTYQPLKGANDFYITAFQKAILEQTSGVNTGNQLADGITILGTGSSGNPFYINPSLVGIEEVIELITFASSNPSGVAGQMYYNTTSKKILTYTDSWGDPTDPLISTIYIRIDSETLYRWSGSTMIVVGGSGASAWGSITGTLSNQTDLKNALDGKSSIGHNHNLADLSEKSYNSLTDKPLIPSAQIQSDWNQSTNTELDYIKNKPTIPSAFDLPATINSATNKDAIADTDKFAIIDTENSNSLKSTTWSNIKTKIKEFLQATALSITEVWTFTSTKLAILGSSTGKTIIASANASATDYTATLPAETGVIQLKNLTQNKVLVGNSNNVATETDTAYIQISIGSFTGAYAGLATESNWINNFTSAVAGIQGDRMYGTFANGCKGYCDYSQSGWNRVYTDTRITDSDLIAILTTSGNWTNDTYNASSGDLGQEYITSNYAYRCIDGTNHTWYRDLLTSNVSITTDITFFPKPQVEIGKLDNDTFVIEAKFDIASIMVEAETTTAGNISIGSSDGATDIVNSTALPTTIGQKKKLIYIQDVNYPTTSNRTMYINISSAASVKLHIVLQKQFA